MTWAWAAQGEATHKNLGLEGRHMLRFFLTTLVVLNILCALAYWMETGAEPEVTSAAPFKVAPPMSPAAARPEPPRDPAPVEAAPAPAPAMSDPAAEPTPVEAAPAALPV